MSMTNGTTVTETDFLGRLKYARELSPVIYQDQFGVDYMDQYALQRDQSEMAFTHFNSVGLAR